MRHRDHIATKRSWTDGVAHLPDQVENGQDLLRHRLESHAVDLDRCLELNQVAQESDFLLLLELGESVFDADHPKDVGNSLRVHR